MVGVVTGKVSEVFSCVPNHLNLASCSLLVDIVHPVTARMELYRFKLGATSFTAAVQPREQ